MSDTPLPEQGGDVPTGLDEAVRMFKGYVRGENGFDELGFKEWLIEWHEQEIAEARIDELQEILSRQSTLCSKSGALYIEERVEEIDQLRGETK